MENKTENILYGKLDLSKPMNPAADKILTYMVDHMDEFNFITFDRRGPIIELVFNSDELAPVQLAFSEDKDVLDMLTMLREGKVRQCPYCGAYYFNMMPYTYRNHGGCVGRSYECAVCSQQDNATLTRITETRRELGPVNAIIYAWGLLGGSYISKKFCIGNKLVIVSFSSDSEGRFYMEDDRWINNAARLITVASMEKINTAENKYFTSMKEFLDFFGVQVGNKISVAKPIEELENIYGVNSLVNINNELYVKLI